MWVLASMMTMPTINKKPFASKFYASPSGLDSNPGTIGSPFKTWQKLASVLHAGDTGFLRGGTYTSPVAPGAQDWIVTWQNLTGTSAAHIVITNFPGEAPVLDLNGFSQSRNTTAIRINNCTYLDIIGIRLQNVVQTTGFITAGVEFHDCSNLNITNSSVHNIGGAGWRQSVKNGSDVSGCNNFTWTNCDASWCADPVSTGGGAYGNADGFDANGVTTYINCRSWWNSDDGFDCFGSESMTTYQGCWSFRNGYVPGTYTNPGSQADGMGFKWGSNANTAHLRTYTNCISFDNKAWGFDQNVSHSIAWFYNNTSYRNKAGGWATGYAISPRVANVLKNNISFNDPTSVSDLSGLVYDHNTWNGTPAVAGSFLSLDTTGISGARNITTGALPVSNFLHLSAGSNMIDIGTNVGLSFNGPNPDLGAYEFGGATNIAPTSNAGSDIVLTLPTNSTPVDGSGSNDPDGTIASYHWDYISGPATYVIANPNSVSTIISNLSVGVYIFRLTVVDNIGTAGTDLIQITVSSTGNTPPIANAGTDVRIIQPTSTAHVTGSGSDAETSVTFSWSQISGPLTGVIVSPTSAVTDITGLTQVGDYNFRLAVSDGVATSYDNVNVRVDSISGGQKFKIKYFGYHVASTGNLLEWRSESESQIKIYYVQKSTDSITWSNVKSMSVQPDSSYSYFDSFPFATTCAKWVGRWCVEKKTVYVNKHWWYRIVAMDFNNVYYYSEIIKT